MEEMKETGPAVEPLPERQCRQARPHDELISELLDSRRLKTGREHAAAREIERLRADNMALRMALRGMVDTADRVDLDRPVFGECKAMRAARAALADVDG